MSVEGLSISETFQKCKIYACLSNKVKEIVTKCWTHNKPDFMPPQQAHALGMTSH